MRNIVLVLHIVSALIACLYVLVATFYAVISRGSYEVSKFAAVSCSLAITISGLILTFLSAKSLGVFCLQASLMLVGVYGAHKLLAYRLSHTV